MSAYYYSLIKIAEQSDKGNIKHPVRRHIKEARYRNFSEFVEQGMDEETLNRNLHFRPQIT
ncbi:MAG: hypothetical protein GDA36_09730 [Rhodobacteraceae bacterium]|nr:hypothetical protein [Paracoccaceae bacterium]